MVDLKTFRDFVEWRSACSRSRPWPNPSDFNLPSGAFSWYFIDDMLEMTLWNNFCVQWPLIFSAALYGKE